MSGAPLQIAVPDGTAPYWHALLRRSGLRTGTIGAAAPGADAGTTLFLPDAHGLGDRALRREVARLRENGVPTLAGREWGACFGVELPAGDDVGFGTAAATTAAVRRIDPAPLLVLPLPRADRLLRPAAQLTTLAGPEGLVAREVIAAADHGGLRRCLEAALRSLAFAAGRPFVHLAHAPLGYDGALAIRIDADDHRAASTRAVSDSLAEAGLRATWFIDVERHLLRDGMPGVRDLRRDGHEVQSHFFRHYTYRSAAANERNLRRSLTELRELGITATAAAAPFGTWNHGLDAALRACGMRWSSEFSRVHDDVPGPVCGAADEPWQVPIHPVCPALLFAAGATPEQVHTWFLAELRACLQRGEPAVFYGHPIADLEVVPGLLPELARAARAAVRSLWQPTLGELHDFHRRRAAQEWTAEVHGDRVAGTCDGPAPLVVERDAEPAAVVAGEFGVALRPTDRPGRDHGPILIPAAYRPRAQRRDRLRTHRLQLARLLREIRR